MSTDNNDADPAASFEMDRPGKLGQKQAHDDAEDEDDEELDVNEDDEDDEEMNAAMRSWADAIGKQLIKEVKLEIPGTFIYHVQKICITCKKEFSYKHSDDTEKLQRLLCWNKSGNLELCLDCDK